MIIEFLDGSRVDLANYNCKCLKPFIPSVTRNPVFNSVDGRYPILTQVNKDIRLLKVELMIKTRDITDFYLLRDELNELFFRHPQFFIMHKKRPSLRWLVTMESPIEITPKTVRLNSFLVNFTCVRENAESIGTCLDLQNRKEWDVNLWSWGMGLDWDKEYRYEHSSNNFVIDNVGNVAIDPCEHELEITIKATTSSFLEIKNDSTGDIYRYNGSLTTNDVLILKGVQSFKNGVSVFKNTNKKLLTLGIGSNQFTVTGGTIASISFNFRFLYM